MGGQNSKQSGIAVGVGYFLLAAIGIVTTRIDGGPAFLWFASPMLIAALLRRPRREWKKPILWSAVGSMLATGLFGAGWPLAPILAFANMMEALVAAYLLRMAHLSLLTLGSMRWIGNLFIAAGLAGPLAMGAIATLPMWLASGVEPAETITRILIGHGIANLTFIPVIKLFTTGASALWRGDRRFDPLKIAGMFALQIAITSAVFVQADYPLLFLPILPIIIVLFHDSSRLTALSLIILAVIGGMLTASGHGPIQASPGSLGREFQFFQFYLFVTVFTIIPCAAGLRSRSRLSRRVRDSEVRYRMLADHSSDIITHSDLQGRLLYISRSIEWVGGYDPRSLIGSNLIDLIDPRDRAFVAQQYGWAVAHPGEEIRFEYRGLTKSSEVRWFESLCRGVEHGDGRTESLVSIVRDVSDRKRKEDELQVAASTDALTGIANLREFRRCSHAISADQRVGRTTLALMDIDFFKSVNDRFGHEAGDLVLKSVAAIAVEVLRQDDMMARIGGEEFAILFPGLGHDAAKKICERIRTRIAATAIPTAAGVVHVTISGGVTELRQDGLEAALKRADAALYAAKASGRDQLQLAA